MPKTCFPPSFDSCLHRRFHCDSVCELYAITWAALCLLGHCLFENVAGDELLTVNLMLDHANARLELFSRHIVRHFGDDFPFTCRSLA